MSKITIVIEDMPNNAVAVSVVSDPPVRTYSLKSEDELSVGESIAADALRGVSETTRSFNAWDSSMTIDGKAVKEAGKDAPDDEELDAILRTI